MRIAEAVEQAGDPVEAQYVRAGRQGGQPVQLGLDLRIIGNGVIGHGAFPVRAVEAQAAARGVR